MTHAPPTQPRRHGVGLDDHHIAPLAPPAPVVTLQGCSCHDVDPASIIALAALGGSGVAALWKIANGLGRFEARTTVILEGIKDMLADHEDRLREIERPQQP